MQNNKYNRKPQSRTKYHSKPTYQTTNPKHQNTNKTSQTTAIQSHKHTPNTATKTMRRQANNPKPNHQSKHIQTRQKTQQQTNTTQNENPNKH